MKSDTKEWLQIADEDYEVGLLLFQNAKHPHAVYNMCQAVEKILKAAQIEITNTAPRKTHNLARIAQETELPYSSDQFKILQSLTRDYGRVRYPDYERVHYNTKAKVEQIINHAKDIYQWTLKKLKAN